MGYWTLVCPAGEVYGGQCRYHKENGKFVLECDYLEVVQKNPEGGCVEVEANPNPDYTEMKPAKICVRENGRLVCKQIEIEKDIWKGHLDSVPACVKRGLELIEQGRDYQEIIQQLNLIRVWNKNKNPILCRRITECMREIAERLGKRSRIRDIC